MRKRLIKLIAVGLIGLTVAVLSQVGLAKGHGGGLDSDGGHNCYVGSCAGTYHCHRSWGPGCGGGRATFTPYVPIANCVDEYSDLDAGEIKLIQLALTLRGYNPGPIDGILGSRTTRALNAYERGERIRTSVPRFVNVSTLYELGLEC